MSRFLATCGTPLGAQKRALQPACLRVISERPVNLPTCLFVIREGRGINTSWSTGNIC